MPYVQRKEGAITGVYAQLQPGYAVEFLPEENQEVADYRSSFFNDRQDAVASGIVPESKE